MRYVRAQVSGYVCTYVHACVRMHLCIIIWDELILAKAQDLTLWVKSGKFGHQVNSDIRLQTVDIQMRRLLMSRLIRIFTVCLFNLFFNLIIEI